MSKKRLAIVALISILSASLVRGDGSPIFHLDFSSFDDLSGNALPVEVGEAVSLVPGGGPTLAGGVTLDAARWDGEEDETNQILILDHAILDAVTVSAGSIVAWIKPEDGDEWNNIAKTPCEFNEEPCDEFNRFAGIEFQASGPHAGVFGAVQGWDTNVFGPDTPLGEGGETDTPSGEWTHAALTWNADGDHTIYVNGEPGETVVGVGEFDFGENETGDWTIGGDALGTHPENVDGSRTLRGELADFAIFDGELTPDEIQEIMSSGIATSMPGDFDRNGVLDAADIDALSAAVRNGGDASFDLTGDGVVDLDDRVHWVEKLKNTYFGDSNLDGEFNSSDFVSVFAAGEYEDEIPGNSTWVEGDWNGNGDFQSSDFVAAFQGQGYESGPRVAAAVPEPSALTLWGLAILPCLLGARRLTPNEQTRK